MSKYKPYENLAREALKNYDLEVVNIEFLIEETNIFYTLHTNHSKYVLKIFQEESSKFEDNLIEALLLKEVTSKTNIVVPSILPTKNNEEILFVSTDGFPIKKRVAIYRFVEGTHFDQHETSEMFFELGKTMALLHQATKQITLPDTLKPKRWDKVFYYRDEEVVFKQEKYKKYFSEDDICFYDKFNQYLNKVLPDFYKDDTYLLHADFNPWNILVHNNEIRLLDFEEGMEGSVVHEMAICLFYYRYDQKFNYSDVKNQLYKGYEQITPLPKISDFDIDLLIMARTANFINYVLLIHDDPKDYIKERIKRIKDFLDNYEITI